MSREKQAVTELAEALRAGGVDQPEVAYVLGSGLSPVEALLPDGLDLSFADLPGLPAPTVAGHAGKVLYGKRDGVNLALLCGRVHLYEGHSPAEVVRLVRAIAELGCRVVVLTNAAGGINKQYSAGDLMLIEDHLNLQGCNAFTGPHEHAFGVRFPDQSYVYSPAVVRVFRDTPGGIDLHVGVYLGNPGPLYETPAEVRMAAAMGADAVGMSTVQEAAALAALGVQVGGISVIANPAAGLAVDPLTHQEVVSVVGQAAKKLADLLAGALPGLGKLTQAP